MLLDKILSLLNEAPPRSLIHSFLNGYARLGSGELSGPFFVKALEPLGHRPSTVRRTLHRMVETQELVSERRGRFDMGRTPLFGQRDDSQRPGEER